ncbi:MAG: TIGR00296 family protein [Candidatus Hydrothermarchaeota archaeon]|jgi:hypothetical protein|nr:TIGR00296 family protein [Candidatus Hydrothermarchaeota archaeon]MDP6612959.1 TIGR00296 family protein [Candidatus Hydrothermarchaeota archaeon]
MYTLEEGEYLARLARRVIAKHLKGEKTRAPEKSAEKLREKAGVFVTLETYPTKDLRGCIGYPEPVMPLVEALMKVAVSAATNDPRFPPLQLEELETILVEVSILTKPKVLTVKPKEYVNQIDIGKHGLIVEHGFNRGLLLPQVAVDENWDKEDFLAHTCMKAGLLPDAWLDEDTKVYRFEGIVFMELIPEGRVVVRELKKG